MYINKYAISNIIFRNMPLANGDLNIILFFRKFSVLFVLNILCVLFFVIISLYIFNWYPGYVCNCTIYDIL